MYPVKVPASEETSLFYAYMFCCGGFVRRSLQFYQPIKPCNTKRIYVPNQFASYHSNNKKPWTSLENFNLGQLKMHHGQKSLYTSRGHFYPSKSHAISQDFTV